MENRWSIFKKIGFLFLLLYFFIYINSSQFILTFLIEPIWQKVVPWFANLVGHDTPITTFANGSGDTTYNYYQVYFFAVVAIILALVIGLADYKRKNYRTLFNWFTLFLRYYLAMQMINYGFAKLYYMQFSFPSAGILDQRLGDMSPMRLLWSFMGYSKGYTMFTGAMELVGGLLLLTRRTTLLGALLTFGVMSNVMMLNYCYDVPVKLLSTHMVVMSLVLVAIAGKPLFEFFFTNKSTKSYAFESVVPEKYEKIKNIVKWIILVLYLGFSIYQSNEMSKIYGPAAPKPLFYGKYAIESFYQYNDSLKLEITPDSNRWETFYQNWEGYAQIVKSDDKKLYFSFEPDTSSNTLKFTPNRETIPFVLDYERLDSSRYHIFGAYKQDSLDMIFRKEDINERLLVKRGFHWINEFPYNR